MPHIAYDTFYQLKDDQCTQLKVTVNFLKDFEINGHY